MDKALKIFPEFIEVLADKGAVLIKLQRYEEALDTLNKALEYKPNYSIVLTNKKYLSKQLKEKGKDIIILENKGKIDLICHKCGNQVFFRDNYCYKCGAQIGKKEGKVPFLHFGPGFTTVEAVEIKELNNGRIQMGDKEYEPLHFRQSNETQNNVETWEPPSPEDMLKLFELTDKGTANLRQGKLQEALTWFKRH